MPTWSKPCTRWPAGRVPARAERGGASRSEQRASEALLADRCEALILLGPQAPAAQLASLAAQLPVICVARRMPPSAPGVEVVRTADDDGASLAVDHLVALGHHEIVHIDGGRAPGAADRRRGYRTAMRRHGLSARVLPGGLSEEDGAAAAGALLTSQARPTAVLAFNDQCATGVLDVFLRAGVAVPGQISVVGFDDSHLARLAHINLTSVGQDIPRLGRPRPGPPGRAARAGPGDRHRPAPGRPRDHRSARRPLS